MTPGIDSAKKAGISYKVHSYAHDPASESYGEEAADKLGLPAQRVFKTLVVSLDGKELAVAVLPVSHLLGMKQVARGLGSKKAAMADRAEVERSTGYVLGGVSPLGQKRRLRTLVDASAADFPTIYVSAGRRGLEIELRAEDLCRLLDASLAPIAQPRAGDARGARAG